MRYLFLFALAVTCNTVSFSQSSELPKIRFSSGFFSTRYEIGEKDVTEKQVSLHLEKSSPESYYQWKRGRALGNQALVWSIIGTGGMLVGVLSQKTETKLIGYSTAAVGFTGALVCEIASGSKKEKAIRQYNKIAGY